MNDLTRLKIYAKELDRVYATPYLRDRAYHIPRWDRDVLKGSPDVPSEIRKEIKKIESTLHALHYLKAVLSLNASQPDGVPRGKMFHFSRLMKSFIRERMNPDYEEIVGKRLGKGEFGVVSLCSYGEKEYAKKIVKGNADLFDREVKMHSIAGKINGVINLYGFQRGEDKSYFLTQYASGGTLDKYVREAQKPIMYNKVVLSLAVTLQDLSKLGIVHGDVKPMNIFILPSGTGLLTLRLGDFGYAYFEGDVVTGGTPYFNAPEKWRGAKASHAMDLWSLGVVAYQFLTCGKVFLTSIPRTKEAWGDIVDSRLTELASSLDERGADPTGKLFEIVKGLLQLDPKARMRTEQVIALVHQNIEYWQKHDSGTKAS